jgi:hypothetical protein
MAQGTTQSAGAPANLRQAANPFLGKLPDGFTQGGQGDNRQIDGANGGDAGPSDSGTIDPSAIASDAPKRGRRKLTEDEKSARAKARAEAKAGLAVEPGPPDPTILGFATEGLTFLNLSLAARFNAPEFAAISRSSCESVAGAWLKFLGYYVSLAKATGPMGALAGAFMATAFVYGPPAIIVNARRGTKKGPPPSPPSESPIASSEADPFLSPTIIDGPRQ